MHKAVYPVFAFHLGSTQAPCKSSILAVAREHSTQNSNTELRIVATNLESRPVQRNKKRARAKHATPHAKAGSNQSWVAPQSNVPTYGIQYRIGTNLRYIVGDAQQQSTLRNQ